MRRDSHHYTYLLALYALGGTVRAGHQRKKSVAHVVSEKMKDIDASLKSKHTLNSTMANISRDLAAKGLVLKEQRQQGSQILSVTITDKGLAAIGKLRKDGSLPFEETPAKPIRIPATPHSTPTITQPTTYPTEAPRPTLSDTIQLGEVMMAKYMEVLDHWMEYAKKLENEVEWKNVGLDYVYVGELSKDDQQAIRDLVNRTTHQP